MSLQVECEFSVKEVRIIQYTADGLGCKQIAAELKTTANYIKAIRSNIIAKTDCSNFYQVLATALRRGIID